MAARRAGGRRRTPPPRGRAAAARKRQHQSTPRRAPRSARDVRAGLRRMACAVSPLWHTARAATRTMRIPLLPSPLFRQNALSHWRASFHPALLYTASPTHHSATRARATPRTACAAHTTILRRDKIRRASAQHCSFAHSLLTPFAAHHAVWQVRVKHHLCARSASSTTLAHIKQQRLSRVARAWQRRA